MVTEENNTEEDKDSDNEYKIPEDLEIEYYNRTSKSTWYIIRINATGDAILETYLIELKEQKQYNITHEELYEIYHEIITNNFFMLNETDSYYDYLLIKADGEEHIVKTSGSHSEQIDNITKKIMALLKSKDN